MAEALLSPSTLTLLTSLLEPKYNASIGRAAAWADAYAHTPAGRFSYQWHWIDTHDWAPDHCGLDYSKDCAKGGCVVSAIANQTDILRECVQRVKGSMEGEANVTCSEALKWVAHFVGDVHQPLHASGRAAGGNFYKVKFGGRETELHAVSTISRDLGCGTDVSRKQVWDGYIPYYAASVSSPFSNSSLAPYFSNLLTRIRDDKFYEPVYMWKQCVDPSTPEKCAEVWAKESNALTCSYVYKHAQNGTDLGDNGYALGAVPIAELRMAKAAVRLGEWLERLVGEGERMEL
jgi:hypothetical protein